MLYNSGSLLRSAMEPIQTLGLVFIICSIGISARHTPCSLANRATDLGVCLDAIRVKAEDKSAFWFGTSYFTRCPLEKRETPNCLHTLPFMPHSLTELTFRGQGNDLYDIDRYLHMTFTSSPGNYTGCDHHYATTEQVQFTVDPLEEVAYPSWDLRQMPALSWEAGEKEMFTLIIFDPSTVTLHGLYVNIVGNDITNSLELQGYRAMWNVRNMPTPFIFLIFKQKEQVPHCKVQIRPFNTQQFVKKHNLLGPVAVSWLLAAYDAFGVETVKRFRPIQNCAELVKDALLKQAHLPFLPAALDIDLKVHLRVKFTSDDITYNCGPINITHWAYDFFLDPIGNPTYETVHARKDATQTTYLEMNRINPNNAEDFKGKLYSLVIVDTDATPPWRGNRSHPMLHGLTVNIQGGDVDTGRVVNPYKGALPRDGRKHTYHYLLYEQQGQMALTDTTPLIHTPCQDDRCLFNMGRFISEYKLQLVGVTWMSVIKDRYLRCIMQHE